MKTEDFTPKPGDTVFSLNGLQAEYVCAIPAEGHVVRPIYEGVGDDDAPFVGEASTWARVYPKPPTEVLHKEVQRLTDDATKLRDEIAKMREDRRGLESDSTVRMAKLQRHEKLARLEDFLDGKLTHFAVFPEYSSGPYVLAAADAKSDPQDKWSKDLRLLSLLGNSNGDLAWKLNQYYDGSGSGGSEVIPCCSEEEAKEFIRKRASDTWELWRLNNKELYTASRMATSAAKVGFEVPEDVKEAIKNVEVIAARRNVEELQRNLAAAKAKLEALNP